MKMILYSNLCEVSVDGVPMKSRAVLSLTSEKLIGKLSFDTETVSDRKDFFLGNNLSPENSVLIDTLFKEAVENEFEVKIGKLII